MPYIHNVYDSNTGAGQSVIPLLWVLDRSCWRGTQYSATLTFTNLVWEGDDDPRRDDEAEELLQLMDGHQLELLLPPGSITFDNRSGRTMIDLV